jgi:hypothetical protein
MVQLVCGCLLAGAMPSNAEDPPADRPPSERWAVILVGIPGDKDHEKLFRKTADAWQEWLTGTLQFEPDHVLVLAGEHGEKKRLAGTTSEAIRTTFTTLSEKLKPDDALWVFTLGHGHYDGKHAWFHVSGRDPSNDDFGRWLAEVRGREQVIWLTHASSGWFVKPLSQPGRIVIAATAADDESNETEFPEALASVAAQPAVKLDEDRDGQVSVAEMFIAVVREVLNRFNSDKRLPTEHAQIDDNGDGRGTEELAEKKDPAESESPAGTPAAAKPPTSKLDGDLARRILIPYRKQLNEPTVNEQQKCGDDSSQNERRTSNFQRRTSNRISIRRWTFDVGCSTFAVIPVHLLLDWHSS